MNCNLQITEMKRGRERGNFFTERVPNGEMGEGGREEGEKWLTEVVSNSEMGEGGGKRGEWVVEPFSEGEMNKRGREDSD